VVPQSRSWKREAPIADNPFRKTLSRPVPDESARRKKNIDRNDWRKPMAGR
jgi:hypothetical protein